MLPGLPLPIGSSGASGWPGADNITRSAWFDGSADHLDRTPSGASTDRTRQIWGCWVRNLNPTKNVAIFSAGTGGSERNMFINASSKFNWELSGSASTTSDAVFRDSEWMHLVVSFDGNETGNAARIKLYLNGVETTLTFSGTVPTTPDQFGDATLHTIGSNTSVSRVVLGSLAQVFHIDGESIQNSDHAITDLGEFVTVGTNGSIWAPRSDADIKTLVNAAGSNSFLLSSDIGDGTDDSSKGNNFTPTSMSDSANGSNDSPSDPHPSFNFLHKSAVTATLSEGGRRVSLAAGTAWLSATQFIPPSGKYYVEVKANTVTGSEMAIGVCNPNSEQDASPRSSGFLHWEADGDRYLDGSQTATEVTAWAATNVVGLGINMDDKQLLFYDKDGNLDATVAFGSNVDGSDGVLLYLGNLSGSGAQDATLIAESAAMTHGLPTGYSELKTQKLPEITTQGADVFQTLLYTGNATDNRDITGAGFKPDFLWHKRRNGTQGHKLIDSSRGVTAVLASDSNSAESGEAGLDSFQSDGIRVDDANNTNDSGATYAAWCWKVNNGTTATNENGSIDTTVQVASEGHISIATLTATGSAATYGHGLSGAPDFVTIKRINGTDAWYTWMSGMGGTQYLTLDTDDAVATNSAVYTALPTSTVVNGGTIFGAGTYVMYCFRNVAGLLHAGKYVGNGSSDGPMILTGFQPRFLLIKGDVSGQEWEIYDTARNPTNDDSPVYLEPDNDGAEGTDHKDLDLLSNGFKIRDTTPTLNTSGTSYFYVAIADVATGTGLPPIPGR